jgi:glucose-6-phosphate-specific signal transduction histidine kinase
MKHVYGIHKIMSDQNLILVYEGEFTQEITKSVLSMAERNLDSIGEEQNTKRKVFNVMVECLQNICKHADGMKKEIERRAIFMIGMENDSYMITSGNYIVNENIEGLEAKLHQINNLDKEGLKNLYKDLIKNGELSEKGGAGLGFVDIARKSGQKLEYDFTKVNEECSFFSFKTKIVRSAEQ